MALDRVAGEVSEELRASFESWDEHTLLRQYPSTDCVYRPTSMRAKILRELPKSGNGVINAFTYAELMATVTKLGGSLRDVAIMATHLNHQTILAIWQNQIPDKRLRFGPPPKVTPSKRRRTEAPPDDDDDRTEDYAGPPVDVSAEELDAAKASAAALHAAAALADADLATKKRQRRETIDREIERLKAARDALESDVYVQPPPPPPLQQPPAPPPLAPPPAPGPYYVL